MSYDGLWKYTLQPEDTAKKYLEILKRKFHFSNKLLQTLKQGEKVWVNGQFTYLTTRGQAGETLSINFHTPEASNLDAEPLPLEVLYEDDYLLAVNKPAGQVVHPNPRYPTSTLGNAVANYWQTKGESHTFRPIHRIDRNTSGVIVIAKNKFAHQQLAWQLEHGQILKRYLGFVSGKVPLITGELNGAIGFAPGSFIKRQVQTNGLPALTRYRVLRQYLQAALLEFELATGRTHQIRVHCQSLGHPLLGDDLYDGDISLINRQALHSFMYCLKHPATGQQLVLRARFPNDLVILGQKLFNHSQLE
ncbi:MAG: RluA family pseudouridine synthase [Desulfitobacteriaceae bacterium]